MEAHRLFLCARCRSHVRICVSCDHNNRYCSEECRTTRRRDSVRRAGARYQRTERGAAMNASRQRAFRLRRQSLAVTHHTPSPGPCGEPKAPPDPDRPLRRPPRLIAMDEVITCSFCDLPCSPFARLDPRGPRTSRRSKRRVRPPKLLQGHSPGPHWSRGHPNG